MSVVAAPRVEGRDARFLTGGRPVLSAVDGTAVARHAVGAAEWLARELRTGLVLAHVFEADRPAAERMLERAARMVTSVEAETVLAEGRAVPELLRLADDQDAGLIVTGTAALGPVDRILLGSVAAELAASAPRPLVAVPPDAALEEPGPIVVGYDGSAHSERAARHAADLALWLRRELLLVHVTGGDGVTPDARLAAELAMIAPGLELDVLAGGGDPAVTLATVAADEAAALLVTGIRSRGPVASALLGSVSARLLRTAERPVMLVPVSASR